ncbi:protein of unknown function DUF480 [Chthoniobacter flavus Ellin428]|uniref:Uncharacterized protein n=1 Tax=Chthoniobacter flavus Ellin428 TaxID=497964 RepID=B4D4A4_9BACT|nr:YceH family protein [Chthoniobacter flavus]EDY18705.1 protein of unknown function DUF480 [Chthoniobacter flavus Ellin428]TCO89056.1 hypothetical protein EV701_11591 [Chthoniobacter flavus]
MSTFALTPVESRVLGCLIEKERTTPENYPLSINGLTAACNQSTNREPVMSLDEKTVENGVNALREKKLASVIFGAGSRVQKYKHRLLEHYELNLREVALLCVLLLRGPQTPGELRGRTERLSPFESTAEVEICLDELARGDSPLVLKQPARPGQKEARYVQLLSAEVPEQDLASTISYQPSAISSEPATPSKLEALTTEVATLRTELEQLREEFRTFRRQFE